MASAATRTLLPAVSAAAAIAAGGALLLHDGGYGRRAPSRCDNRAAVSAEHERTCSLILQHLLGGNGNRGRRPPQREGTAAAHAPSTTASGERVSRWLKRTAPGVECRDGLGRSALALASMQGDAFAAGALVAAGYNVNGVDGNHLSPLSYAAWKGHADAVRLLLQHGADPTHMDDFGVTPLHKAAAFGHILVLSQLLRSCPHPTNAVNLQTGPVRAPPSYEAVSQHQTPLHLALRPSAASITPAMRREMTDLLLGFGADPNVPDAKGDGALHYACRVGEPAVVWALLAQGGADPGLRNAAGESPLRVLPWYAVPYLGPLLLLAPVCGGGDNRK